MADRMDASGSSASESAHRPSTSPTKRLIFDLRYGWVYDEWKEPSKEALSGGRGMFCILPIAKGVFDMASQTVSIVSAVAARFLQWDQHLPNCLEFLLSERLSHAYVYLCIFWTYIGIAASSTTKVLGRPEVLLASVGNQFQKFTASIFGASSDISRANGDETLVQSTSK